MDGKKLGIIAGAAAGLFLLGLVIGYAAFSGGARIRELEKALKDEQDARARDVAAAKNAGDQAIKDTAAELEKARADLDAFKKDSAAKVAELTTRANRAEFEAKEAKSRLAQEVDRLNKELADAKKGAAAGPEVPKLVNALVKVWPAWSAMALGAKDLASEVQAARFRIPDKAAIDAKAAEVIKASLAYKASSVEVYNHVLSRRNELRDAGFDCAAIEKKFADETRRLTEKLVAEVENFKDGISADVVEVDATKGFSDTRVPVAKGDLVFVTLADPRQSTWQMSQEWGEAGPEGWEQVPGHLKIDPKLRGGSCIVKIGVSDVHLPGYGQMPQVATEAGRLRIGINDKKLDDNLGVIKFNVVKVSTAGIDRFMKFWKDAETLLR